MINLKIKQTNSRKGLVNTLLNDQSYHIEFNGHLTNHNKHAVIALYRLGASKKRIKEYYESYALKTPYGFGLESAKPSKYVITHNNWKHYLGKRTSFSSYCNFFDRQERKLGTNRVLAKYLPTLLSGWVGSFTHATIHLGWALDISNRWMIIEGLAYMAFSYVSCHPEKSAATNDSYLTNNLPIEDLLYISGIWEKNTNILHDWVEEVVVQNHHDKNLHPELIRSGLQYRIAKLFLQGHPLIYLTPAWLNNQHLSEIWESLYFITALLYMAEPGDFIILHLITSLHAMEQIANFLPVRQQRYTIQCFWIGMLGILFSRATFPSQTALHKIYLKYKDAFDVGDDAIPKWCEIVDKSIQEDEEHNPKMVYVLQRVWKKFGCRTIFRDAASNFTTTPQLPKSFELAPTE